LCDYNRAGVPLAEIVTEPDLSSPQEAKLFAETLQKILQYADASEADMYKGQMRFDASISLRPMGEDKLYPRVEIKNLNSFKALETALIYEEKRLQELWEKNAAPTKETTVGWLDDLGKTKFLRDKEGADDYRYFPEPDLPPLVTTAEVAENLKRTLPELPRAKVQRFQEQYGLTAKESAVLAQEKTLAEYFEAVAAKTNDAKKSAAWVSNDLLGKFNEASENFSPRKISAENLAELIALINSGEISGKIAKEVFVEMWSGGQNARAVIEAKGLKQISDSGTLEKVVAEVLAENPQVAADFKSGKEAALGFLVGQFMKKTKGQANPKLANEILRKGLKK
jgi:aspartyl-tRNA(Asn)/glutamyl-tRNA(Gln) amidotransferase subunit B